MLKQVEGSAAVAEAVALARPEVICAYPISPQTHIVEDLASFKAGGCCYLQTVADIKGTVKQQGDPRDEIAQGVLGRQPRNNREHPHAGQTCITQIRQGRNITGIHEKCNDIDDNLS